MTDAPESWVEKYRHAWRSLPWAGLHRCRTCRELVYCRGRTASRQDCLPCFAAAADVEAQRIARRARRAERKAARS